ncbi:MAG: family 20 glycosylhydrolase [Lentisphaeria bacterium]|nr:family 20 glycosylhydrolase [Lentisphaeria bacterium]
MQIAAVHIDLKGVLFRPEYMPQLFEDLASQRINAVLVEYEDVFPFQCVDVAWDKAASWTLETLRAFQSAAAENGIEIIPLQQCLGHLEYLFRWPAYRHLAEDPSVGTTVCPTNLEATSVVASMLREVLETHPDSKYVHLGMDEADSLVTSERVRQRGGPLPVFLEHLRGLCDIVESYGKTPIIWSDMLEDHFEPDAFAEFTSRVVLAPWDYTSGTEPMKRIRLAGHRVMRDSVAANADALLVEDLPANVLALIEPDMEDGGLKSLFQVDLWTRLGFRVIGGTVLRFSAQGPILPDYNQNRENITAWANAIDRTDQLGLIATSWARANTFYPPNLRIDLTWPLVAEFAQAAGRKPEPFWPGVPTDDASRIVRSLGRCRSNNLSKELALAEEMALLADQVGAHRFEWTSTELMARALHLAKKAQRCVGATEPFVSGARLIESEWERRIAELASVVTELTQLRDTVHEHFGQRFAGSAYDEWLHYVFDWPRECLETRADLCRRRQAEAKQAYTREQTGQ